MWWSSVSERRQRRRTERHPCDYVIVSADRETRMDVIALVVSGISLVVALVGTVLANKRASEAIAESRKAATVALWSGAQEAVQRLIGFDPASEPVGERLANFRIAMIALGNWSCLLYTSPSPRDGLLSRMPSSA